MEELSPQERTRRVIELSLNNLIDFSVAVDPRYSDPWHIQEIAKVLERVLKKAVNNEKSRIILEIPPRHGKSELATIKFPAWALGKYPSLPVVVCSYSESLAITFGLKTRDIINDDVYKIIFRTKLRSDQKAKGKWLVNFEESNGRLKRTGGGYTAAGVGSGITGRGFKIGIIDDPFKDREEAESEIIRNKIWDWYKDVFYTRQESNAAIIVIAARWHTDDLIGRLIEKENEDRKAGITNYDKWEIIKFPAIAEEDEKYRKKGEALWPEKFSIDQLKTIENTQGQYAFSALYQQEPISSEIQEFRKEFLKYYKSETLLTIPGLRYYTLVDLAHSEKKENHETVIRTIAKAVALPQWYLIEESAGHYDPGETIDKIWYHAMTYQSEVWIEGVGYQRSIEYHLKEKMKKEQTYFIVNLLKRNQEISKAERIRGLLPLYRAGIIFHRDNGLDAGLERQLLSFPKGKLDDRIDCLANGLEAVRGTHQSQTERIFKAKEKRLRGRIINKSKPGTKISKYI